MIHINQYFDNIFLINLKRRPDKLSKVLSGLDKYNIKVTIIEAIDGYDDKNNKDYIDTISYGAQAYTLTWKKILKMSIEKKYKKILLLDDDVILSKNFDIKFNNSLSDLKLNTIIWLLGCTQHVRRLNTKTNLEKNFKEKTYRPLITDGSFAVGLLSSEIIKEIYKLISKTGPSILDSTILRKIYNKYPNCIVSYPNIIISSVEDSNIRETRDQIKLSDKVGWDLKLYHYPLHNPLISIIVPCYNATNTIERCLESLISQRYRPLEIIVIDDYSNDNSYKLISDVFNKWNYDNRSNGMCYKMCQNEKNQGCYRTRNRGLDLVTGDFIAFQDSDDISYPNRILYQYNSLVEHQVKFTSCLILRTHLRKLSYNLDELSNDIKMSRIHKNENKSYKYCCRGKVGLVTTLFRKSLVNKLGKYLEWKWGADDEYVRRIFPNINHKMMNYLDNNSYIKDTYYKVNEILYLSYEMTEQNLTMQRLALTIK